MNDILMYKQRMSMLFIYSFGAYTFTKLPQKGETFSITGNVVWILIRLLGIQKCNLKVKPVLC